MVYKAILRRFVIEDAEEMFANWANDLEVVKYMRWNAHTDINETKKNLQIRIEKYQESSTYYWAITLKTINKPIGNIASGIAMQKAGMRYEGRMRQKYRSHVGFEDSDLYAILKEDLAL